MLRTVRRFIYDFAGSSMKNFNANEYLSSLNVHEIHLGLESVSALLSRFGNPQNDYPVILIGGTNGKGSTAAMIDSILRKTGRRVGLYTSPHLVDVRERIVFSGKKISHRAFGCILREIKSLTVEPLTYFEVLTAAALIYFQRCKADVAVLEVGMGGRLDATNICRPLVSVVTNIGLEHIAYLGKTLTAIAGEKAGIIHDDGICVTAVTQEKVARILKSVCGLKKAAFYRLGTDFHIVRQKDGQAGYRGMRMHLNGLEISLVGGHQLFNAAVALATLEAVGMRGLAVNEMAMRNGLKETHWEGRLETLCRHPLFLVDGAHNPAGTDALIRELVKDNAHRRRILIFAALADKNVKRMMQKIIPATSAIILPKLRTSRAIPPTQLADMLKTWGCRAMVTDSVDQAVGMAFEMAAKQDMILATGSLYLIGEIKEIFSESACCDKETGE